MEKTNQPKACHLVTFLVRYKKSSSGSSNNNYHTFITSCISASFHRIKFITNKLNDQLPIGLLAQLAERCSGIVESLDHA